MQYPVQVCTIFLRLGLIKGIWHIHMAHIWFYFKICAVHRMDRIKSTQFYT